MGRSAGMRRRGAHARCARILSCRRVRTMFGAEAVQKELRLARALLSAGSADVDRLLGHPVGLPTSAATSATATPAAHGAEGDRVVRARERGRGVDSFADARGARGGVFSCEVVVVFSCPFWKVLRTPVDFLKRFACRNTVPMSLGRSVPRTLLPSTPRPLVPVPSPPPDAAWWPGALRDRLAFQDFPKSRAAVTRSAVGAHGSV